MAGVGATPAAADVETGLAGVAEAIATGGLEAGLLPAVVLLAVELGAVAVGIAVGAVLVVVLAGGPAAGTGLAMAVVVGLPGSPLAGTARPLLLGLGAAGLAAALPAPVAAVRGGFAAGAFVVAARGAAVAVRGWTGTGFGAVAGDVGELRGGTWLQAPSINTRGSTRMGRRAAFRDRSIMGREGGRERRRQQGRVA